MPTQLSIHNYYYPRDGSSNCFLGQNRLLENAGWEVVPFSMQHPNNLSTRWGDYFVDNIEMGGNYSLFGKANRAVKTIYSFEARRKISKLIDQVNPDIVHAHNIYHHLSPSVLSEVKSRNIPIILSLHDLKLLCPAYTMMGKNGICEKCKDNKAYQLIKNRCIKDSMLLSSIIYMERCVHDLLDSYRKNVDYFRVISKFYLQKFMEWGWDTTNFTYIPNFVYSENITPEYTPGNYFVYFGRLSREKGLFTLLKAASIAKVKIVIVGSGPEKDSLIQCAEKMRVDVKFPGYLQGVNLYNAIRSARATVLPSEWYENAPMSIIESYALGKPVIGADIGGIPELIKENATGVLFHSGDHEDMAQSLLRLADMPAAEVLAMGRVARRWIEADFSPQNQINALLSLYARFGVMD